MSRDDEYLEFLDVAVFRLASNAINPINPKMLNIRKTPRNDKPSTYENKRVSNATPAVPTENSIFGKKDVA